MQYVAIAVALFVQKLQLQYVAVAIAVAVVIVLIQNLQHNLSLEKVAKIHCKNLTSAVIVFFCNRWAIRDFVRGPFGNPVVWKLGATRIVAFCWAAKVL